MIVALVVVLAILLVGSRFIGLKPFTVLSGSMEPKYHVGSLIYVEDVDPAELAVGDPLTFSIDGTVVTHQIVDIIESDDPSDVRFVTQGLTNNMTDGEIGVKDIIGKPVFTIPYLGYISVYLQNPIGIVGVVCFVIILLMISFLFELVPDGKKDAKASAKSSDLTATADDPDGTAEDNIKKLSEEEEK